MNKGFTLIEIMFSVAIISVLTSIMLPSSLNILNHSMVAQENSKLNKLEASLRLYIEDKKIIPSFTTWRSSLASSAGQSVGTISTTEKNMQTIYVYPDNFLSAGVTLPYDQVALINAGAPLSLKPSNPRVMIISNMGKNALISTSGIMISAAFDAVWDQSLISPSFVPELKENKDTLLIKRVDLSSSFKNIVLNNNDPVNIPSYTIDGNPLLPAVVPPLTTTSLFVINSSQVKLLDPAGIVNTNHVTLTDLSFDFFNSWGSIIGGNGNGNGGNAGGAAGGTAGGGGICTNSFGGVNGALSNSQPKTGCVSGGNFALTVNNTSQVNDVNLFYGDVNGVMIFLFKVKKATSGVFLIPGCSFVAIVPQDQGPGGFNLFYMGNAVNTVNVI